MLRYGEISAEALAHVLSQSSDCVKLISPDGNLLWMNFNGQCAMEIDDFEAVQGQSWACLWPEPAAAQIDDACKQARAGKPSRFHAFCPTAKGSERWWDVSVTALTDTQNQFVGYLSVSRDVTAAELARQALDVAASELRHRLRNSYAIITSLIHSHARGNPELERFAGDMSERLSALANAQTLFHDGQASCRLEQLIPALVQPFGREQTIVTIDVGPGAAVDQASADTIALVVGELAVNSTKHGAIAHGGEIIVEAHTGDAIAIRWDEESRKHVERHARDGGQGLDLIRRIARARQGSFDVLWKDNGLTASLTLPL